MSPPRWLIILLAAVALAGLVAESARAYRERQQLYAVLQAAGNQALAAMQQRRGVEASRQVLTVAGHPVEIREITCPFAAFPRGSDSPRVWLLQALVRVRTLDQPRLLYQAVGLVQSFQPQRAPDPDSEVLPPIRPGGP